MSAGVQSVVKAHQILSAFMVGDHSLSIRQISAKTRIPRSTVHELCRTLVQTGQLEFSEGAGYRLGVGLVAMAGPVLERIGLIEMSTPSMSRLATLPSGEVFLGLMTYPWVTYVSYTRTQERLPIRRNIGLRVPLHTAGSGVVVLAKLGDAVQRDYLSGLPAATARRVTAQIESSLHDGYLFSESFQRGIRSVSAPIVGPHARVIGALAVCQDEADLDESNAADLGRVVRREAIHISRRLQQAPRDT